MMRPPVELDDPTAHGVDDAAVVGGHDHGRARAVDAVEQAHDADRGGRVEVAGGLVGQQDQRPVHERPGDRDPLLLATGELVGEVRRPSSTSPTSSRIAGTWDLTTWLGPADDLERERHVLEHGLVGEQLEVLEDAADVAAQVRDLPAVELADVLAGDEDAALGRVLLLVEEADERRLARARRADQEDELALLDVDVGVAEGVDLALVGLGDVLELDHGESRAAIVFVPRGHRTADNLPEAARRHVCRGADGRGAPRNGMTRDRTPDTARR